MAASVFLLLGTGVKYQMPAGHFSGYYPKIFGNILFGLLLMWVYE